MYGKLQKKMGLSLIIFAFFFLFEPSYGLIDPLPDAVGYLILCLALSNLADINDRIMTALHGFGKVIILSLLRVCSLVVLEKVFVSDEQTVGQLIFVFLFAFFEILLLLPAYKALFEGLLTLGIFNDGDAVYYKRREKGRNRTEKMYSLTIAFVILKNLICALPDFTSLQTNSAYEFITITRILVIIAVSPLSIAWLISIVFYFFKVGHDEKFVDSLTKKYQDKLDEAPCLYLYRTLVSGLTIILISLILTFDLYSQNINYVPDAFFCALALIAAIILKHHSRKWVLLVAVSAPSAIYSLFLFIVEKDFFERHFIGAIKRDYEAYRHYYFMLGLYILQALIAISLFLIISWLLYDVYKGHTVGNSMHDEEIKASKQGFSTRLTVFLMLGVLSAIASVYRVFSLPYFSSGWFFEYSAVISSVISIGFIASACVLIGYIRAEINKNYKLYT